MKSIAIVIAIVLVLGAMLPLTTQVAAAAPSTSDKGAKKNQKLEEAKDLTLQLLRLSKQYKNASEESKAALLDQLVALAMKREQALVSLVRDGGEGSGPAGFLNVVLSKAIRQDLPKESQKYLEQEVTIEGVLTVLHSDDFERGISNHQYYLSDKKNSKLEVHFADKEKENLLHANAKVRVNGVLIANQELAVTNEPESIEVLDASGVPSGAVSTQAAPNTIKVAVILFNFNYNKVQPFTKDEARVVTFTGTSSVNAYYREISFGKIALEGHLRADGDIFGWYTVTSDCSNWGAGASNAASQLAQADGFNPNNYDKIIYGFPWTSDCPQNAAGWAGIGGKESWIHGYFDLRVVTHELGHNFGLHHASSLECTGTNGDRVHISDYCYADEYGDPFDAMGNGYYGVYHFSTYHKGKLNYHDPINVLEVTSGGTYSITPIEQSSTGVQAIRIPRGYDPTTGNFMYYYLEYRKPFGFDNFSVDSPVVNGISLRLAPGYPNLMQTKLIDGTPATATFNDAALKVGSTFKDPYTGITLNTISVDSDKATVIVQFGDSSCMRAQPEVAIAPANQWGRPGDSLTYSLYVANHDSPGCPDSNFTATPVFPSGGWLQYPANPSITLSPGSSGVIQFSVTSHQTTVEGFYILSETVVNDSYPSYSATASASYNVEFSDSTPPSITPPQTVTIQAASGDKLTNLCVNLGPSGITASGNDGNLPSNVNDNNLSTRWSNQGKGSWITLDLSESKVVCGMDIAWYKGISRSNYFVISGSTDGTNFETLYSDKSSGTTTQMEHYEFADTVARYIKVTVNGNTLNTWASITEIDVLGYTSLGLPTVKDNTDTMPLVFNNVPSNGFEVGTTTVTWTAVDDAGNSASAMQDVVVEKDSEPSFTLIAPPSVSIKSSGASTTNLCQNVAVSGVTAKGNDGNVPANVLDNSLSTRWSNLGKGSWITLDIGQSRAVCNVDIAWYKGNERSTNFVISVSIDGVVFKDIYEGKSTGKTTQLERYEFADSIARYIKVTVNGNSQNNWASITEIDAAGYVSLGLPTVSGTSDTSPLIYNNVPADGLPAGTTILSWTAVDAAGNMAYATQEVKIASS